MRRAVRAAMASSSARLNTLAVGFIGELNRISLVLALKAAANASRGSRQSGGDSRTIFATPPASSMIGK